MLHVLFGEDDFSVRQAIEEIKKSIGDPAALMSNTTVLDGRQLTPEQLRAACETVPFLADKRLVIAEGLLERFEPKRKSNRKKSSRKNEQDETYQSIADAVRQLPPFVELVIFGGKTGNTNPLLQALMPVAKVKSFSLLNSEQLTRWIEKRLALLDKDCRISSGAARLMVRLVGSDLWTMANEIDKLVQYTGGRQIEEEDVKAVVSNAKDASVFAMVDAIFELRVSTAQELLQQLFQQGMVPAQILVMLARQIRIILLVREMREKGKSRGEIQKKLGLKHEFALRKAFEQADKYSPARIKEVYHQLLETDIAIKTGKMEEELALDMLISRLGRGVVSA